jgi:hypothetical protein
MVAELDIWIGIMMPIQISADPMWSGGRAVGRSPRAKRAG